jgi:hypothetical protein
MSIVAGWCGYNGYSAWPGDLWRNLKMKKIKLGEEDCRRVQQSDGR